MASATNGSLLMGSGSIQDRQHPWSISLIMVRFRPTSPPFSDSIDGINPGLRTMYFDGVSHVHWTDSRDYTYRHQVCGIAAYGEELQSGIGHEFGKGIVGCKPYAMAVSAKSCAKSNEGLDIA